MVTRLPTSAALLYGFYGHSVTLTTLSVNVVPDSISKFPASWGASGQRVAPGPSLTMEAFSLYRAGFEWRGQG